MSWCMDVSVVIPEDTYLSLENEKILQTPPSKLSNFKINGVDFVRIDWDWWNHWEDSGG